MIDVRLRFPHVDKVKKWLHLIGLIAGLALFARQVQLSLIALHECEVQIPWKAIVLSVGTSACFYLIQIVSWTLIMKYLKAPIGIVQALQGYTFSFLPRYIPGSVWGYWGRAQWLKKSRGISYRISILGSTIEAIAFVITAFMVGAALLVNARGGSIRGSVLALILMILCWLKLGLIGTAALNLEEQQRQHFIVVPKLKSALVWLSILPLYIVFWVLYGVAVGFIAQTITPFNRLAITIACAAFAWIVGFIIVIIPGGLGIREATLATLLNLTMRFPAWQGDLVAVIFRAVNIFAELIWLLIGLFIYTLGRYRG